MSMPAQPRFIEHERAVVELSFSGFQFRLRGDRQLLARFEAEPQARSLAQSHPAEPPCPLQSPALPLAQVDCELEASSALAPERAGGHPIEWSWQDRQGEVRTCNLRATLEHTGRRQFAVRARLPADLLAVPTLLSAVSPALLHAVGGTVLHAASVEFERRCVAFVGPSGAGKSTACRHTSDALSFSLDRLAVAPTEQGWVAYPLPGGKGSESNAPASAHASLPLATILRVARSTQGPHIEACRGHRRLAVLRQATFHGDRTPAAEHELLAALDALGQAVPVGLLEFALGDPLRAVIQRFIVGGSES